MVWYQENETYYCSLNPSLPFERCAAPGPEAKAVFLTCRPAQSCRSAFFATSENQLLAKNESVAFLDDARIECCGEPLDEAVRRRLAAGGMLCANFNHPRWRQAAAFCQKKSEKKRVHILAIGDVGSTLLTGLKLLGADVIDSIGICDLSEKVSARWEFEMNQIALPWCYDAFPPVDVVKPENLFDCDVFVFVASKGIPPVGSGVKDVRMAQFEANSAIVAHYARMARQKQFAGLFAVVSDPVDPLAKTAFLESNRNEDGKWDGQGLFAEQIQGFGLGVMNARAAYFAKKDPRFASFLTEGRSFGPHGQDLVIANSIEQYDDALSRELTQLTVTANLQMRALGYKPYVAPALSSGALSLLLTLRGDWHCGSVFLGGIYMGVKNRYTANGLQTEQLCLPDALFSRIQLAADNLAAIV